MRLGISGSRAGLMWHQRVRLVKGRKGEAEAESSVGFPRRGWTSLFHGMVREGQGDFQGSSRVSTEEEWGWPAPTSCAQWIHSHTAQTWACSQHSHMDKGSIFKTSTWPDVSSPSHLLLSQGIVRICPLFSKFVIDVLWQAYNCFNPASNAFILAMR